MFESRQSPAKDPLILWLTGGPGCASDLALLAENGPFLMNETSKELYYNDYGSTNDFLNGFDSYLANKKAGIRSQIFSTSINLWVRDFPTSPIRCVRNP